MVSLNYVHRARLREFAALLSSASVASHSHAGGVIELHPISVSPLAATISKTDSSIIIVFVDRIMSTEEIETIATFKTDDNIVYVCVPPSVTIPYDIAQAYFSREYFIVNG